MPKSTLALKATVTRRDQPAVNPDMKARLADLQQQQAVSVPKAEPEPKPAPPPAAQFQEVLLKRFKVFADFFPLAIGTKEKLLELANAGELALAPQQLVSALGYHCTRTRYLKALANDGAFRHDLDGQPVAPVSDSHSSYAALRLMEAAKRAAASPTR